MAVKKVSSGKRGVPPRKAAPKTSATKPAAKAASTRSSAKKSVAEKSVAKKPVAKQLVAKKPVAKPAVGKKPVAKKPVAKKPVAKKPVAKKPVAKKPVARPAVAKKAAARPATRRVARTAKGASTGAKGASTAAKAATAAATKKTGAKSVTAEKSANKSGVTSVTAKRIAKSAVSRTGGDGAASGQRAQPQRLRVRENEKPWRVSELSSVRAELEADIARLQKEISVAELDLAGLMRDVGDGAGDDPADAGTATFEREQEISLANNAREVFEQSARALTRLVAGTYGICESCGNPIGKNRLQAFPRATLCLTCKSKQERR